MPVRPAGIQPSLLTKAMTNVAKLADKHALVRRRGADGAGMPGQEVASPNLHLQTSGVIIAFQNIACKAAAHQSEN